jgi:uracil-DNA glycosylase
LQSEFDKPYFEALTAFVRQEYATTTVYPPGSQLFAAFDACPWDKVKVVILGQDPYHGPGQAHGLSFSVNDGVPIPPSLANIYKELRSDLGIQTPASGNLMRWASQGVLLLNATLSVRAGQAASHQKQGWEDFTDAVIRTIATQKQQIVFMLWGNYARRKATMIDEDLHLVLQSAHPSPLSAHQGFLGNKHFSQCNTWLQLHGLGEIVW